MKGLQAAVCLIVSMLVVGCAGVMSVGPGGASPGAIYTGTTYPNALNPSMEYQIAFDREDIELRGPVEAVGTSQNILGLFSSGDSGYGALMDAARARGADGVMNVTVDTQFETVLLVFTSVKTKLTGQAYSYKK